MRPLRLGAQRKDHRRRARDPSTASLLGISQQLCQGGQHKGLSGRIRSASCAICILETRMPASPSTESATTPVMLASVSRSRFDGGKYEQMRSV
eukprot:scaffold37091_cov36-Tisochrysis_lutea.AAC.2